MGTERSHRTASQTPRKDEEGLLDEYKKEIDEQFKEAEKYPQHTLEDVFAYMYSRLPPELEQQKSEYQEYLDALEAKERER
ncbi:MAG: hypothetical protein ACLFQW_10170 [Spirochaetaceae bacterium]